MEHWSLVLPSKGLGGFRQFYVYQKYNTREDMIKISEGDAQAQERLQFQINFRDSESRVVSFVYLDTGNYQR